MSFRSSNWDGPEDVDAAFAEIVAELEREGLGRGVAGDEEESASASSPPTTPADQAPSSSAAPTPSAPATESENAEPEQPANTDESIADDTAWNLVPAEGESDRTTPDPTESDEHYVPPEPPPLPRLRAGTIFGVLLLVVGVLLLVAPGLVALAPHIGTPIALVCLAAGIAWLVIRMRKGPPSDSDWDDGAQV